MFPIALVALALLPVGPAAAQSRQEIYDAAQAAFDRGDWVTAADGFGTLAKGSVKQNRGNAVIHGRLAQAMLQLGHFEGAAAEASAAVAMLVALGAVHDDDLADGYTTLGDAHRLLLNADESIAAYDHALAATTQADGFFPSAAMGLATIAATVQPDRAAEAMQAITRNKPLFDALAPQTRGRILALQARAELNRGRAVDAYPLATKAVDVSGGLTETVSVAQVQVRGDAGLIAAILNKPDDTRRYLAYSGAGHLKDHDWLRTVDSDLPVCDDEVRPDDFAVVEFAIGPDGKAIAAIPVYASRPGTIGLTFARAVSEWQWDKTLVAQMGYVWRASVRLELRCAKRPPPLSLADAFRKPSVAWLRANGIAIPSARTDRKQIEALATAGPQSIALRAIELDKADAADTAAAFTRLAATAREAGAPPELLPFLLSGYGWNGGTSIRSRNAIRASRLDRVIPLLEQQGQGGRGPAWLRTELAIALETSGAFDTAKAQLDMVVALPPSILPEDDPIRSIATLHRAMIDQHQGNSAAASQRLRAAGLDAEQCALLDVRPVPSKAALGSGDFPTEALRWGFEGNVTEAFDIAADGSVSDVRTVIAYPPFVFSASAAKSFARFKYLAPTIGNQAVGCIGQTVRVKYRTPH